MEREHLGGDHKRLRVNANPVAGESVSVCELSTADRAATTYNKMKRKSKKTAALA
jgi:hypothetical protein